MTAEQHIAAKAAQYPTHGAGYFAYYAGRNDAADGLKAERLTDPTLRGRYLDGYRSARAEMRLDADVEWDRD